MKKILTFLGIMLAFAGSHRLIAQALPSSYYQTAVVSGLTYPVDFDWTPDGRYLVTLKGGNTAGSCANGKIQMYDASGVFIGTFYDLTDSVNCDFERGIIGIAVDPNFTSNHYVYVYYVHKYGTANSCRILRFTEVANVGTSPTIILDINVNSSALGFTPAGNHFGGMIRIRPSQPDKIYLQLGDLAYNQSGASAALNMADKLNKPFGKILRINTDGSIPTDNPFYDDGNPATGNDDRIWTYGNRNGLGMTFSPVTDSMYFSENGYNTWDEFNIAHKGGNYGWNTCEGDFMNSSTSVPCNLVGDVRPMTTWGTPLGGVTGTVYYSGSVMPEFDNHILVADNDYGRIYDLTLGNPPNYDIVTSNVLFADVVSGGVGAGLTTMREGSDGCLYAMKGGYTTTGTIYRICHVGTGIDTPNGMATTIGQNYPNPTDGNTQIDYSVNAASEVSIDLFDVTGRKIQNLLSATVEAGKHTIALNDLARYAMGAYFYQMEVKQQGNIVYKETKRLTLVK